MSLFKSIAAIGAVAVGTYFGQPQLGVAVGKAIQGSGKPKKVNVQPTSSTVAASNSVTQGLTMPAGFDAACYLENHPDVARDAYYGANPYLHYQNHGNAEGRETACRTPQYANSFSGGSTMTLLPAVIARTLPTVLPGVGTVLRKAGGVLGGAVGGAVVVDQMGNILGRTGRRRRSMNPLNPKAAGRAIRRIKGVRKFCQRIEASLPKRKASVSRAPGGKKSCR